MFLITKVKLFIKKSTITNGTSENQTMLISVFRILLILAIQIMRHEF
jgi:hypothetical protein